MTTETIFSQEQHASFERDGYVLVSGLLDDHVLDRLVRACDSLVKRVERGHSKIYSHVQKGLIFSLPPEAEHSFIQDSMDAKHIVSAFREVAIRSKLGQGAAELMQLDPETQNARILRDVVLAKPVNTDEICDWHVDDHGFWPESFVSEASKASGKDQDGINVWLALDDMPAKYEGSMAVSVSSHKADFRFDAYRAIGQDRTTDGSHNKDELLKIFASPGKTTNTCNIQMSDPDVREAIESSKVVFDLKRGDAIFATRLLFHRTLSVTEEGKFHYKSIGKNLLSRYSIRYVPGSAKLPEKGVQFGELSLCFNPANHGRSLDDVEEKDGAPWYPKVWPFVEPDIEEQLDAFVSTRFPLAVEKAESDRAEFFAALAAYKAKMHDE